MELWDQLQSRAQATGAEENLIAEMTFAEVKDCTSEAIGSQEEGSCFDKTIEFFENQRKAAEALIISALKTKFPANFSDYLNKPEWQALEDRSSK